MIIMYPAPLPQELLLTGAEAVWLHALLLHAISLPPILRA